MYYHVAKIRYIVSGIYQLTCAECLRCRWVDYLEPKNKI